MDFREHSQFVYIPSYGIQSLDNYARKLYQGLGFEVRPIDVTTLYRNGGSLRCFANVTRRIPDLAYTNPKSSGGIEEINVHSPGLWDIQRISVPTAEVLNQ